MERVVITDIILDNDDNKPVIVQFENAKLAKNIPQNYKNKTEGAIYFDKDNLPFAAVSANNHCYTGAVNWNSGYNEFLLIGNEKSGEARLISVNRAVLTEYVEPKQVTHSSKVERPSTKVSKTQLSKHFGSKRLKRLTEQRERMDLNVSNVKEDLEKTIAYIDIDENDFKMPQVDENDNLYRPKINRAAETVQQVYDILSIVPENILNTLTEEVKVLLHSNLNDFELIPIIKAQLEQVSKETSLSELERCKILLYCNYLIKFLNQPVRNFAKKFNICLSSKEVNNHIMNNFTIAAKTGRQRPMSMRDKAVCYILVLAMLGMNYQIDLEKLSKDLKIGIKKLEEISRVLAFSSFAKMKNVMVLKLPLPAPVSKLSKSKSKRK